MGRQEAGKGLGGLPEEGIRLGQRPGDRSRMPRMKVASGQSRSCWGQPPPRGSEVPRQLREPGGAVASGVTEVRAPPACAVLWLSRSRRGATQCPLPCLQPLPLSSPQTDSLCPEGAPPPTDPLSPARPALETAGLQGPQAPPHQPILHLSPCSVLSSRPSPSRKPLLPTSKS